MSEAVQIPQPPFIKISSPPATSLPPPSLPSPKYPWWRHRLSYVCTYVVFVARGISRAQAWAITMHRLLTKYLSVPCMVLFPKIFTTKRLCSRWQRHRIVRCLSRYASRWAWDYASFTHALLSKSRRNRLKMAGDASTKRGRWWQAKSKNRIKPCQKKEFEASLRIQAECYIVPSVNTPVFFHPYVCRVMFP